MNAVEKRQRKEVAASSLLKDSMTNHDQAEFITFNFNKPDAPALSN